MNALLRLLVVGRFAASIRNQAKIACIRAAVGAALVVLLLVGAGFLVAAGYQVLSWRYSGPVAATVIGGGFILLAAIVGLVGHLVVRRRTRPAPASAAAAADPVSAGIGALLTNVPPSVLIAAVAGLLYGLRGKGR